MNSTTVAIFRKTSLALAVLAVFCASNAMAASADSFIAVAHTARLQTGDAVTGDVPASQAIHIEVVLKLRDRAGLDQFITNNAKSPVQHPMSHDQFMANHAPTQAQAQAVADYLEGMGYRNIVIAPNRLLVSADGTAQTAGRAFMTNIEQVRTHEGRIAFMNTSDVLIPAALQDSVLSVLGLQTVNQAHLIGQGSTQGVHTDTVTPHNPLEFSSIYGGASVATGAGVDVGLFINGNVSGTLTDLAAFATNNSLSRITTSVVATNGGGGSDTSGRLQWDTNSQGIVGAAGGKLHSLVFYTIPNLSDANVIANFNTIVSANVVKIIDVSVGGCETDANASGTAASTDEILATGVAQGQTFAIASGDSGTDACGDNGITPSWPASSQYAIAVGGTTLNASSTTWSSETAWAHGGGGPSTFEAQPSWQNGNVLWHTFRSVPDVAFDADPNTGATIVYNGGTQTNGGTTLSASIFSGLWARVLAVKGKSFGFAGPLLYKLSPLDRHDVTSGNNGYPATIYWDYTSGFGSLILSKMINDIGNRDTGVTPPVPNFTYGGVGVKLEFDNTTPIGTYTAAYYDFDDGSPLAGAGGGDFDHTFPGVGTYNVTLTTYDANKLNPVSKTVAVPVNTTGQVLNTGFETGISPWSFSSPGLLSDIRPHGGQWDARLGGTGKAHTDVIKQTIRTKPHGGSTLTLTFYVHIETSETTTTDANDILAVSLTNANGGLLATLHTYSNLDANTGYVEETLDLTPYATSPANVIVRFVGTENSSKQTTFFIDDVRVVRK